MPLTYTTPQVTSMTANGAVVRQVVLDLENGTAQFRYDLLDSGGSSIAAGQAEGVSMTLAAFYAAVAGSSGSAKNRIYAAFQSALGLTGTVT
jgi:hypothetical protein